MFMSCGQIRTDCNSLILLGRDLHPVRHGKGQTMIDKFYIPLIFQYDGGRRPPTYED